MLPHFRGLSTKPRRLGGRIRRPLPYQNGDAGPATCARKGSIPQRWSHAQVLIAEDGGAKNWSANGKCRRELLMELNGG